MKGIILPFIAILSLTNWALTIFLTYHFQSFTLLIFGATVSFVLLRSISIEFMKEIKQ